MCTPPSLLTRIEAMEQLEDNLLFRWFVGLKMDDRVEDFTVFTKNCNRLLEGEIATNVLALEQGWSGMHARDVFLEGP